MPALLEVDRLKIDARDDDGDLAPIVRGVSFSVDHGEVVALIGESGSGKTTIALSALGYVKPGLELTGGEVRFEGRNVIAMPADERRAMRGGTRCVSRAERRFHLQSRLDDRETSAGVRRAPRSNEPGGGRPTRRVALPSPEAAGPGARGQALPAPGLRRPIAEADGRHGAMQQAGPADSRRADHRPGRDDPDRGTQGVQVADQAGRRRRHLRDPRYLRGGADRGSNPGAPRRGGQGARSGSSNNKST